MTNKQTPGPWSVNSDMRFENGKPGMVWGPMGPGHGVVCELPAKYPREFNESDARLIASAPDLLEALDTMVKIFNRGIEKDTVGDRAILKAKQAISKATGI